MDYNIKKCNIYIYIAGLTVQKKKKKRKLWEASRSPYNCETSWVANIFFFFCCWCCCCCCCFTCAQTRWGCVSIGCCFKWFFFMIFCRLSLEEEAEVMLSWAEKSVTRAHCQYWRCLLIPGVNVLQCITKKHFNARCKGDHSACVCPHVCRHTHVLQMLFSVLLLPSSKHTALLKHTLVH